MDLKDALSFAKREGSPPLPAFHQPRVRKAGERLASIFTEADEMPAILEIADVAKRLRQLTESGNLNRASKRDWRKASWCLWFEGNELASSVKFLSFFLARVKEENRRGQVKKLISAYLRDYAPDKKNIRKVGDFLSERVKSWEWVWAMRQSKLQLFDHQGASNFATQLILSEETVGNFLEEQGLTGELVLGGFARHAFLKGLAFFSKLKIEHFNRVLDRILDWSIDSDGIRYPGLEPQIADALLLRWANSSPDDATRKKIETYFLTHFGDPRIPGGAHWKWTNVSDDSISVILRWLVGAALDQFLQVVDKVAMPSQWRYRKAFWKAYYNAGVIDEAWVAFAWEGQLQTRKSFGNKTGFGRLEGSGVSSDHAVLIMKIGGITIADWSHNGKCHIWTASRRNAPKLYRQTYYRHDLVEGSSNGGEIHTSSRTANWQAKIGKYIARNTNIHMAQKDYMPRRRR